MKTTPIRHVLTTFLSLLLAMTTVVAQDSGTGWSYNPDTRTLTLSGGSVDWDAFKDYNEKTAHVIFAPSFSVSEIPSYAFSYFPKLKQIEIPNCVTTIGDGAFTHSSSLTTVTFSSNSVLQSIGCWAFNYSPFLTTVYLPSSLHYIREWAFYGCDALKNVILLSDPTTHSVTNPHVIYLHDSAYDKTYTGWHNFPENQATLFYDPATTYIGDEGTTDNLRYYFSDVSDISTFTPAPAPTSLTLPAPTALPVRYYDLNGRKVSPQTHRGLIIKTQGNRSTLTLTK